MPRAAQSSRSADPPMLRVMLSTGDRSGWLRAYYAATPLFALADFVLGASVRAAAFGARPGLRSAYYGLCVACLALSFARPGWSSAVALAESSLNLLLLVLAVFLPYWALADAVLDGRAVAHPFSPGFVVNFCLAGAIWTASCYETTLASAPPGRTRARRPRAAPAPRAPRSGPPPASPSSASR
jgi:hypothetical protein